MAFNLAFGDREAYKYYNLDNRTESELRKEYSRLRAIANKRITRLEKAGFGESALLERYGQGFAKTRSIAKGDTASLKKALYEVAWFTTNERSTVSAERKAMLKEIKKLHENGYDFVNESNYYKFKRFMQKMRDFSIIDAYGSNRVAEIFPQVEALDEEDTNKLISDLFDVYIGESSESANS